MSFEIKADGVDVERLRRVIRERVEEKKKEGRVTEEEVREIAERALEAVLEPGELREDLLDEFQARVERWNYSFGRETLYRSSRGALGRALAALRRLLRPMQKLFWNPDPMIAALSRQSDLNRYHVHLLHNLVLELTRLNLQVQELRSRNLQLAGRLEQLARREKTLEEMAITDAGEPEAERGSG
jgi:DNA repair exonuclease SbcCD ATPase subunit